MELSQIIPHVEALVFASDKPLINIELVELLNNALGFIEDRATIEQVDAAIEGINEKYSSEFYAFELKQSGGGWQFLTKKEYHKTVAQLNGDKFLKRLSTAALETLAIIAYKQPIAKSEMEAIRGVNCDYAVQKLLEKDLVIISGRNEDAVGKPLIYATSKSFMDYFGINSTADLPKISEVLMEELVQATLINHQPQTEEIAVVDTMQANETDDLIDDSEIIIGEETISEETIGGETIAEEAIGEIFSGETIVEESIEEVATKEKIIGEELVEEVANKEETIEGNIIDEEKINKETIVTETIDKENFEPIIKKIVSEDTVSDAGEAIILSDDTLIEALISEQELLQTSEGSLGIVSETDEMSDFENNGDLDNEQDLQNELTAHHTNLQANENIDAIKLEADKQKDDKQNHSTS